MAARRRTTATATRQAGGIVVVNTPQPVARRASAPRTRTRKARGRKRSKGGGGAHSGAKSMQGAAIGGLAFGLLKKHFPLLPRIPGIGTSGTVALAVYFLKPSNPILRDMGIAAAAIAGYSFGETGTVSGDSDLDDNQ